MAYGNVVKKNRDGYPRKMERKAMLSAMVIRGYRGGNTLTSDQIQMLRKHSVHHSISHIKQMVVQMAGGDSFDKAHKKAQKKIGK